MIEDRDWQKVGYGSTRLKVPGGWFVLLYIGGSSKSAFFYPDPNHLWDGNALPNEASVPEIRPTPIPASALVQAASADTVSPPPPADAAPEAATEPTAENSA